MTLPLSLMDPRSRFIVKRKRHLLVKFTYSIAIDPGIINMGWVKINLETGEIVDGGVYHFFDSIADLPKPDPRGSVSMQLIRAKLELDPFFEEIMQAEHCYEALIEDQTKMDQAKQAKVRIQTLALENALHFHFANPKVKARNICVNGNAYKSYWQTTGDDANKTAMQKLMWQWFSPEFAAQVNQLNVSQRAHIADAAGMARWRWELHHQNYVLEGVEQRKKQKTVEVIELI